MGPAGKTIGDAPGSELAAHYGSSAAPQAGPSEKPRDCAASHETPGLQVAKTYQQVTRRELRSGDYNKSVFLNCPFDSSYKPIWDAMIFTLSQADLKPRCALEVNDGAENRLEKIFRIVSQCRYGIHDISRTELDPVYALPRFNMPLELGIFLGAKRFGGRPQGRKACLILARELYDYQKFLSDLAGQDAHAHHNDPRTAVIEVRNWLRSVDGHPGLRGGVQTWSRYLLFRRELPQICRAMRLTVEEITFTDLIAAAAEWLRRNP